jgi:hypothetical protein
VEEEKGQRVRAIHYRVPHSSRGFPRLPIMGKLGAHLALVKQEMDVTEMETD